MLDDIRTRSVSLPLREAFHNDVIARGDGCYKLIHWPGVADSVWQVLLARPIDAYWYVLTLFNVENGAIQDWRCGDFTPVYVFKRGEKL